MANTKRKKASPPRKRAPKPAASANSEFTTYTIRAIPTPDWLEFKHKLDSNGHKVNWVFAELIRRVGSGEIALVK